MSRIDVLGTKIDNISLADAVELAWRSLARREGFTVVTPNTEMVLEARKSEQLRLELGSSELVLPDGIGVVYASRILGTPIGGKVAGIDFASALLTRMAGQGRSVFLFGARPGVAEAAAEAISERYPGIRIAGTENGYFTDDAPIIDKINAASPDFLMVCLGCPKQELWMAKNREKLRVGVMAGLGGALNVYAGTAERAPQKWIDLGLEWLYRLIKEPNRIRRMIKLPGIILAAVWKRIGL